MTASRNDPAPPAPPPRATGQPAATPHHPESRQSRDERLRALFLEQDQDVVFIVDASLIRRYVSPTSTQFMGYPSEELLGKDASGLDHPADSGRTRRFLAGLATRPNAMDRYQVRVLHRDGSTRWLDIAAVNRLSDPEVAGFVVSARDVTEGREPDETLHGGREQFRALIQHASDIITILDADGTVRYESPALEGVLGYTPEELVGTDPFALIHPEEVVQVRNLFDEVSEQPGRSAPARFRFRHRDGSWRWLEVTATNLLTDPSVSGIVVNSRDVTDGQRAEEELREEEQRNRELLLAAQRQAQELALLDEVRTALARELELPELIRTVVEATARTLGYSLVSLYLLEEDVLVLQHQVGYHRQISRIPVMEGVVGRVVRTGEPILLSDVRADPDFLGAIEGIVSEVCVPLRDQERVVGLLNVESTGEMRLTDADLRLMVALSEHVNVAIGRARLYTEVSRSESRFRALIQHADIVAILEANGIVRYISPAVESVLGYAPSELVGRKRVPQVHPEDQAGVAASFDAALSRPGSQPPLQCRMQHKDGSWSWLELRYSNLLEDSSVGGIIVNARDVTERKEFEERLRRQAHHDPLTSLPNRARFLDCLTQALSQPDHWGDVARIPVLFLDLDGFKFVNDSLGHVAGDRLLVAVAERLALQLRPEDVIARFGGDEFAVLVASAIDSREAVRVAERLIASLAPPFTLDGREAVVTASVGVVVGSPELTEPSDLFRAADVALYRAKAAGKGSVAVFDPARDEPALVRLDRETALRRALVRDELKVAYQPIIDLESRAIIGVEALARWDHPERGLIPPEAFMPLAEETGLMIPLGRWLRAEACRQVRDWQRRFPTDPPLQLSVNLSAREIRQPDLIEELSRILREAELPPDCLTLEVTESAAIAADLEAGVAALNALKRMGVRLALDDFGTGYASLSALRRFPIDELKVDRSFVAGLGRHHEDTAIVWASIGVAKALSLDVTAEGVETRDQVNQLRDQGCDRGQGYFFAPPLFALELDVFLQVRNRVSVA